MSDSMQPTVLTVDTQGRIGAVFTGTIFALGLSLPVASEINPVSNANRIQWTDSNRKRVAELFAYKQPAGGPELVRIANSPVDLTGVTEIGVDGLVIAGADSAITALSLDPVAHTSTFNVRTGGESAVVVNSVGASSFLQLVGAIVKRRAAFGVVNVKYPGGSPNINTKEVAHGLGVVPAVVIAIGTNGYTNVAASAATNVKFNLDGARIDGFTGLAEEQPVYWLAIG
jgi:hypothetical protein